MNIKNTERIETNLRNIQDFSDESYKTVLKDVK